MHLATDPQPHYGAPGSDYVENGALAIGTGPVGEVAVDYTLTGNSLANAQVDRLGLVYIADVAASAGFLHLFVDLDGAHDDVDFVGLFNCNARQATIWYNTNGGKTGADVPSILGGADATWAQYGPTLLLVQNSLESWEVSPHRVIAPTGGTTPAGIRYLWIRLSQPFVHSSWSSTDVLFLGRLWAGPKTQWPIQPDFGIVRDTKGVNAQVETEFGQVWSYRRSFRRTMSFPVGGIKRTERLLIQQWWHRTQGGHLPFPFILFFPTSVNPAVYDIGFFRSQGQMSIQEMARDFSANTSATANEMNSASITVTEEALGLIDLG